MSRTGIISAAVCAALLAAAGASAQQRIAVDRDALARPEAAQALYAAIEEAAQAVCRRDNAHMSVYGPSVRRQAIETCVRDTIDATVQAIDAPLVTALHAQSATGATQLAFRLAR